MAIGSADDDVGPLINWMETDPPGGRFRAYLASRASIRSEVEEGPTTLLVVPPLDVEEGAGRFLFTVAMVDVDFLDLEGGAESGQFSGHIGHLSRNSDPFFL